MELLQYKNLLDQVNAISAKYKKINELSGDNFNVFRILKLESSEVRMHSAFIAELLNPNGTHGQKDVFLKLFVKDFCFKNNNIDTSSCRVKVEENIGSIIELGTQGGRIDIIITDIRHNHIIIENKIYAGDQDNQLTRYYKYSDKADLIYLTLEGKLPSEVSAGDMKDGEHYKRYSYKNHILNWLELCRKEVAVYPIVREAITHYINLIKHLTGQTININMQEELSEIIRRNIEASFLIADNLNKGCDKISVDFGETLIKECRNLGLECEYGVNFKNRYNGIDIYKSHWKYVSISFQFWNYDKDMIFGIAVGDDPAKNPIPQSLKSNLKSLQFSAPKENDWWPWYQRVEVPYNNWRLLEAWQAILDGRMEKMILEKVSYLLNATKNFDM